MYSARHHSVLLFALLGSACGGAAQEELSPEADLSEALSVAACSPRDPSTCARGESCLSLSEAAHVCTTGRCLSQADCRDGYVCRADHCLRLERDPGEQCPRGSRPERQQCARGEELVQVSRAPACFACQPLRDPAPDRCDGAVRPVARGSCRSVLGYFWDGRVCVGLQGCTVTGAQGLLRTQEQCVRTFAHCNAGGGR